jgi:hypothetical protein
MSLANAAFRKFDLTSILDKAKAGFEEAEKVAGQKELTTEQYEKYLKDGLIKDESEWAWNGKGWVNITSGMDNLVEALKQNTIAVLNTTKEEAERKLKTFYEKES